MRIQVHMCTAMDRMVSYGIKKSKRGTLEYRRKVYGNYTLVYVLIGIRASCVDGFLASGLSGNGEFEEATYRRAN